jgi:uncharacterized protein
MTTEAPNPLADAPRMLPSVTDANREFWTSGARGELRIPRCGACGTWVYPPTPSCGECGGELHYDTVSGKGTVFTFTINRHPYNPEIPLPYVIALVELDEQVGLRLITNVVNCDPEDVVIGMPVRVTFEDRGEVFVPVFEPDATAS